MISHAIAHFFEEIGEEIGVAKPRRLWTAASGHDPGVQFPGRAADRLGMNGRQRMRFRIAREVGYLDARCRENQALVDAYGLWCWRLKIPMVWLERRTRCSRYGRVQLEMFPSARRLTEAGQSEMKGICAPANAAAWTQVSAHAARWEHVALPNGMELARAVFRAAIRLENYEKDERRIEIRPERKTGNVLRMASA